jgi:hypothetical protein
VGLPNSGDRGAYRWLVVRISGWRLWGEAVVVAGAGDCLQCFAGLFWRDRMLVSLERTAVEFLEVLAGQALIGSLTGQAGRYSKKVQQPVRT